MGNEFVCFFILGLIVTVMPAVVYITMKLAILKIILDGLRAFLYDLNSRY